MDNFSRGGGRTKHRLNCITGAGIKLTSKTELIKFIHKYKSSASPYIFFYKELYDLFQTVESQMGQRDRGALAANKFLPNLLQKVK